MATLVGRKATKTSLFTDLTDPPYFSQASRTPELLGLSR